MKLIKLKPITNGTRHQLNIKKNLLSKSNRILKKFTKGQKNQSGRSSTTGRITVRHKGGGCKNLYRIINFKNNFFFGIIIAVYYDPNRSSFISLNYNFITKSFFYNLATNLVYSGSLILCDNKELELRLGYRTILKNIPTGSILHSLSLNETSNSNYIRSAGTFGQLIQKNIDFCKIKLPSNVIIKVSSLSYATIGVVSNLQNNLVVIGKAGRNRKIGKRPGVRGIAMNPVDHPHGGRTNGGMPSVTPWGIPTKGKPTVKKKKNYE